MFYKVKIQIIGTIEAKDLTELCQGVALLPENIEEAIGCSDNLQFLETRPNGCVSIVEVVEAN